MRLRGLVSTRANNMKVIRLWILLALACLVPSVGSAQSVQLTVVYAFSAVSNGTNMDGANPESQLVFAPDGYLYGTTLNGGPTGDGIIFRITTNGVLTPLGSFSNTYFLGRNAGLALGPDGNLYGTTPSDGANRDGSVFEVTTNGVVSTL